MLRRLAIPVTLAMPANRYSVPLAAWLALAALPAAAEPLSGDAQALFELARKSPRFALAERLNPEVIGTSDNKSFALVWEPAAIKGKPHKWIVSLHGSRGFATEDLAVWSPHLDRRDLGLVSLQWWFGRGETPRDYYAPRDIYRELDKLMERLKVKPGEAMLEAFSRGAANIYAVAALDRVRGKRYFSAFVANSGGASLDYPPTREVDQGGFGAKPFEGSRWITSCGARDPSPERDGCSAMRRTADWLKARGAEVVIAIEDGTEGHGAFHRNGQNAARALDWFVGRK